MSFALAQAAGAAAAGTTTVAPTLGSVKAGNLVVACLMNGSGVAFTGPGGGWTLAVAIANGAVIEAEIWYLPGVSNAGGTINPTFTAAGAGSSRGFLAEFSGAEFATPLDQTASATATSSLTCASGTLSGSNSPELAIACFAEKTASSAVSFTAGTNFTQLKADGATATTHVVGDYRLGASNADAETETSNVTSVANGWAGCIATFKVAGSPAYAFGAN